jgi:4-amino-4-deoxy-L-arabinose transferase-like glycosyltransferase
MLSWFLTAWLIKPLTLALYPSMARAMFVGLRWEWWLLGLSLLPHLLGVALVPDTLLMPLTCAVMWVTWRLCHDNLGSELKWWLALGLLLGLSGLAKYTAIFLALGVGLALVHAHGMRLFGQVGLWLALSVAVVCVVPVFYWNYVHDWASFRYQLNHAAGQSHWQLLNALRFTLVIWAAYGWILPVAWWVGLKHTSDVVHEGVKSLSPHWFGLYFGVPSLLLWVYLSGRGSTLPHWATPAVVALLPLGAWGCHHWSARFKKIRLGLLLTQALGCVFFFVLMVAGGLPADLTQAKPRANPFADLYGWPEAAEKASQLAERHQANALAVTNWSLASRLAWYARPLPIKVVNTHGDQFTLWFGGLKSNDKVVWVNWSLMRFDPPIAPDQFKSCERLDEMVLSHWERPISQFDFWLCKGWAPTPITQP